MKITSVFLLGVLAIAIPRGVIGHATEIRHCITIDGNLRIFIQHWHGETAPGAGDTMDLRADHDGGRKFTQKPTGYVNNVPDTKTGLTGCEYTISDAHTKCKNQNHDDWVWYDFKAEIGVPVSYTLLAGNSVMLEEGCPELLPVTITGVLEMPTPEQIAMQRELAWEKQFSATVDFWKGSEARKNAKPLDMRTFVLPLEARFPDKVSNGRWIKDTKDNDWRKRRGTMADGAGRILFTFNKKAHSCSATAVRDYGSPDRSLIVTAAHCIFEERTNVFADHVIFIPGQDDGTDDNVSDRNCDNDQFGCWVPEFAVVDSEWASNINDVTHDFGFLVVKNKRAHTGRGGGRDLSLENSVQTVDLDWKNKANLTEGQSVFSMGLPGSHNSELRYAKGRLKIDKNLQFVEGCTLTEGSSGGPMPLNPFDEHPKLFSVNSFKSGHFDDDGEFIQTSCGGPILHGNSYCKLLEVAETLEFGSPEALTDRGIIVPYDKDGGCNMPGWCESDDECDDGLFCNGIETCHNNRCVPGTDPCDGFRCDEDLSLCLDPCTEDSQCDDGVFCNGPEACVEGKCVPGLGNPCASDQMCNPFLDKCTPAECYKNADCDDGSFCNGKELCIEGQCQPGVEPCDADENCDEVTQTCPNLMCELLDDETMCQDDVYNDCCVCMDWCAPWSKSIVECGAWLFFPKHLNYDFDATDEWGYHTPEYLDYMESLEYYGNSTNSTIELIPDRIPAVPTCLMWTLFMDGKSPTRFTEINPDGTSVQLDHLN